MPISKKIIGMIRDRFEQAKTPSAYGDLWNLYIKKGVPDYVLLQTLLEKDTPQQPSVTDISEQLSGQTILPSPTMPERTWGEEQQPKGYHTTSDYRTQEEKARWTAPESPSFAKNIESKWNADKEKVKKSWERQTGLGTLGDVGQGLLSAVPGGLVGPEPNFVMPSGEKVYVPETWLGLTAKSLGLSLWYITPGSKITKILTGSVRKIFNKLSPGQRMDALGPVVKPKRIGTGSQAQRRKNKAAINEQKFRDSQAAESRKVTEKANVRLKKEADAAHKKAVEKADAAHKEAVEEANQTFDKIKKKVKAGERGRGKVKDKIRRPETTPGRRKEYRERLEDLYLPKSTPKKPVKPKTKAELKKEKKKADDLLKKGRKEFVTEKPVKPKGKNGSKEPPLEKWEIKKRRAEEREAKRLREQRTGGK
tara:strand:- start:2756 stop:4021 length:1266 start_codon:yes stop_codon:yes gene_type:complete